VILKNLNAAFFIEAFLKSTPKVIVETYIFSNDNDQILIHFP